MVFDIIGGSPLHHRFWVIHESFNSLKYSYTTSDTNGDFKVSFDEDLGEKITMVGRYSAADIADIFVSNSVFKDLLERYLLYGSFELNHNTDYEDNYVLKPSDIVSFNEGENFILERTWILRADILRLNNF